MGVFFQWKSNQEYIAKHLCENIDKPILGCKGKCQLAKRMQKVDQENNTENNSNEIKIKVPSYDLFYADVQEIFSHKQLKINTQNNFHSNENLYLFFFLDKKIKPPCDVIA